MPEFKSESVSKRITLNDNLVWIHDQQNDTRGHYNWILKNYNTIIDNVSDITWRKFGGQINTNETDYKENFKLYSMIFHDRGSFELIFDQIGPSNPRVKIVYTKKRRLTIVETMGD